MPGVARSNSLVIMLEDPEATQTIVVYEVWANDNSEANQKCAVLAQTYGCKLDRVEQASNWRNRVGKNKFNCWMTAFGDPNENNH